MATVTSVENGWTVTRRYDKNGKPAGEFHSRPVDPDVLEKMLAIKPPPTPMEKLAAALSHIRELSRYGR